MAEHTAIERTVAERVVAFGRALREAGLGVTTGQVMLFLDALAVVGITDPVVFHDAARASLGPSFETATSTPICSKRRCASGAASMTSATTSHPAALSIQGCGTPKT